MAKTLNPGKCMDYLPALLIVLTSIYAGIVGRLEVFVLSAGVGLISFGLKLPLYNTLFFIAMATFLGAYLPFGMSNHITVKTQDGFADKEEEEFSNKEDEEFADKEEEEFVTEGFADKEEEDFENEEKEEFETEEFVDKEEEDFENEEFADKEEEEFENEEFDEKEDFADKEEEDFDTEEGFTTQDKQKKKSKKVRPPPDNGDRAEALVLGKKYKIPSEDDDEDFHLDAGTTFLNAYKSLNPDQISAMTKDTQELINTQKQLMSTLSTLKPLITDGKQMMDTFQNYFGAGGAEGLGDLSKMAEKFTTGK